MCPLYSFFFSWTFSFHFNLWLFGGKGLLRINKGISLLNKRKSCKNMHPQHTTIYLISLTSFSVLIFSVSIFFFQELRGHLETSLMDGSTLLITDVDVDELTSDTRFHHILQNRSRFLNSTSPFKLMVSYVMNVW